MKQKSVCLGLLQRLEQDFKRNKAANVREAAAKNPVFASGHFLIHCV